MQTLAQSVLHYIWKHELLNPGDRLGIAVSGGADSVALLSLLLELRKEIGVILSVVHFNHKLRGADSAADEQFVAELTQRHKLELHCEGADVASYAAEKRLSVEAAARELRYEFFRQLLLHGALNRIATAHTLDDQAETVLLRIVRGAGSRGLAGIYPRLWVKDSIQHSALSSQTSRDLTAPSVIRPLLATRRHELEAYLKQINQTWREDQSNRDLRYARNRVRHEILPLLEQHLNPSVRDALAATAEIARSEEEYWECEVKRATRPTHRDDENGVIELEMLVKLPLALQRRLIREAAEAIGLRLEFRHVEEVTGLIACDSGSAQTAVLPDGWTVSRTKRELRFERTAGEPTQSDYEYALPVPGSVRVDETRSCFEATLVRRAVVKSYNPEHLLDRTFLGRELRVRNWRAGDRFWPAHTKASKKIKELLQERHVSGSERRLWPVVISGSDLVWVRGFSIPAQWQPRDAAEEAVLIRELPLPGNCSNGTTAHELHDEN